MGQTFDSTVRIARVEPGRLVAFEGEWAGMIRRLKEPPSRSTRTRKRAAWAS